jgi:hypothetical protein
MPGTQPRGTHAFDPASSSSQSATQMLNIVDAEEDGAEDQVGPQLDSPTANTPAAPASVVSPLVPPDLGSSIVSSLPPSDPSVSSSSGSARPPPSSSLLPTVHPQLTQQRDISMGSVTTGSEASSGTLRKRKHDARSASGMQPPSSKRASRSKTDDLNPVIISNALNSTLNRMVDVMERTLDVSAVTTTAPSTTSIAPPSIVTSPIEFLTTQLLSEPSRPLSSSASSTEILDQAIRIVSADGSLTEDELFAASLFFTSASEDAICAARTFIALGDNNQAVKYRFLLRQLDTAGLLPGRGKAKAVEDGDDLSMVY